MSASPASLVAITLSFRHALHRCIGGGMRMTVQRKEGNFHQSRSVGQLLDWSTCKPTLTGGAVQSPVRCSSVPGPSPGSQSIIRNWSLLHAPHLCSQAASRFLYTPGRLLVLCQPARGLLPALRIGADSSWQRRKACTMKVSRLFLLVYCCNSWVLVTGMSAVRGESVSDS